MDAFQAVKVLTPEFGKHLEQTMSREVVKELLELKENYKELGIQDFQIPNDLNKIYNDRSLRDEMKTSKCWSSMVSPPLYGTNLMCCVFGGSNYRFILSLWNYERRRDRRVRKYDDWRKCSVYQRKLS